MMSLLIQPMTTRLFGTVTNACSQVVPDVLVWIVMASLASAKVAVLLITTKLDFAIGPAFKSSSRDFSLADAGSAVSVRKLSI